MVGAERTKRVLLTQLQGGPGPCRAAPGRYLRGGRRAAPGQAQTKLRLRHASARSLQLLARAHHTGVRDSKLTRFSKAGRQNSTPALAGPAHRQNPARRRRKGFLPELTSFPLQRGLCRASLCNLVFCSASVRAESLESAELRRAGCSTAPRSPGRAGAGCCVFEIRRAAPGRCKTWRPVGRRAGGHRPAQSYRSSRRSTHMSWTSVLT